MKFNYLLIFGKFGFPKMGVRGAALGTVLAGIVNLLILLFFVLKNKIPYVLEFSRFFCWNYDFIHQYLQKCFPIICNEVMIGVSNMMINIVLGHQSEQAIADVAVFRTLEGLVIAFFSGFSNAATVLVGKEVGAGNHEVAFQRAKRLVYLCSTLIGTACLGLFAIHDPLLHAMELSCESYRIGTGMLIIYSVAVVIRMAIEPKMTPIVLLVFALCYVDEPIRYIIMQCHMYSGKWIKPVSAEGLKTIDEFRMRHGVRTNSTNTK